MMELSGNGMEALGDVFRDTQHFNYSYYNNGSRVNFLTPFNTMDNGLAYNKVFSIDLTKDKIEYPVMCKILIEDIASMNLDLMEHYLYTSEDSSSKPAYRFVEEVVYNVFVNNPRKPIKRTFNSIIKEVFWNPNDGSKLTRIEIPSGEVFYGAAGILLDKEFTPLLLCTLTASIKDDKVLRWEYGRPQCYISPQVLMNRKKNLVYKGIVDRVIPYYSNYKICLNHNNFRFVSKRDSLSTVKVIIDDIQPFFHTPKIPIPEETSKEEMNKFLLENIEDIKCMF